MLTSGCKTGCCQRYDTEAASLPERRLHELMSHARVPSGCRRTGCVPLPRCQDTVSVTGCPPPEGSISPSSPDRRWPTTFRRAATSSAWVADLVSGTASKDHAGARMATVQQVRHAATHLDMAHEGVVLERTRTRHRCRGGQHPGRTGSDARDLDVGGCAMMPASMVPFTRASYLRITRSRRRQTVRR